MSSTGIGPKTNNRVELKQRIIWGVLAALVILGVIFYVGHEATFLVSLLLALVGWREYARMMALKERPLYYFSGYFLIVLMFSYAYFIRDLSLFWVWLIWIGGFFILFLEHQLRRRAGQPTTDVGADWAALCRYILGLVYLFLIFGFIGPIVVKEPSGEQLLLLGLMVVFLGDTGAFFFGRRFGKRKLWPELSPKKTIEGAMGGLLFSLVGALFVWSLFYFGRQPSSSLSLLTCLLVGLVGAPLAQSADFLESLMKRASGRKDSGGFLPGHGGILDRTDGLAFVMPLLYYLL